ncbi:hypothetical protein [Candidatus Phytoplasma meliae]|uniref:Uncharacterized protein n=1 Tax=Candidatus Phytoplasma meliae TaxID=1848402 RepID=A0ABS5CZ08_9MOLU|nr:hypothetical protein [Candidatus Phytoplasma meliae]MBP5835785.1 hypothetical protein [Candidatus Phytoplasma meliae]MBP5836204.1 hypothetical protein [Candidatus Phytoplasma meliae]
MNLEKVKSFFNHMEQEALKVKTKKDSEQFYKDFETAIKEKRVFIMVEDNEFTKEEKRKLHPYFETARKEKRASIWREIEYVAKSGEKRKFQLYEYGVSPNIMKHKPFGSYNINKKYIQAFCLIETKTGRLYSFLEYIAYYDKKNEIGEELFRASLDDSVEGALTGFYILRRDLGMKKILDWQRLKDEDKENPNHFLILDELLKP